MEAKLPRPLGRLKVVHIYAEDESEPTIYLAVTVQAQYYLAFLERVDEDWQYWCYLLLDLGELARLRIAPTIMGELLSRSSTETLWVVQFHRWEDEPSTLSFKLPSSLVEIAAPICAVTLLPHEQPRAPQGSSDEELVRWLTRTQSDASSSRSHMLTIRLITAQPDSHFVPVSTAVDWMNALPSVVACIASAMHADGKIRPSSLGLETRSAAGSHIIQFRGPTLGLFARADGPPSPLALGLEGVWSLLKVVAQPACLIERLEAMAEQRPEVISHFLRLLRGAVGPVKVTELYWGDPSGPSGGALVLDSQQASEARRRISERKWREPTIRELDGYFESADMENRRFKFVELDGGEVILGRLSDEVREKFREDGKNPFGRTSIYRLSLQVRLDEGLTGGQEYLAVDLDPLPSVDDLSR